MIKCIIGEKWVKLKNVKINWGNNIFWKNSLIKLLKVKIRNGKKFDKIFMSK